MYLNIVQFSFEISKYWLKSQKILGWLKVYFINLDSDISFGITFDVHKLQKKYFFSNGNHHFLPNSDDAEEILQSIRFEIPAKTKSEIAVITAVVKASLKR